MKGPKTEESQALNDVTNSFSINMYHRLITNGRQGIGILFVFQEKMSKGPKKRKL